MPLPPQTTPNPRLLRNPMFSHPVSSASAHVQASSYSTSSRAHPTAITSIPPPSAPSPGADGTAAHQAPPSPATHRPQKTINMPPTTPSTPGEFPTPKLRLEIRDLNHPGATIFSDVLNAGTCLKQAVDNVLPLLYDTPTCPTTHLPPTRSVTLILRPFKGVAYTTGMELDSDHKEIHFSLGYVAGISPERRAQEIMGVLTHEMVHCYQWNARGSCPGGLIEGIADWVRLRAQLRPPHWKRDVGGRWDRGYQHTGYFLEYLEGRFGGGTVRGINEKLRTTHKYEEKGFWTELLGRPVEQLWGDYCDKVRDDEAAVVKKEDISDEDVRRAGEKKEEEKQKKDAGGVGDERVVSTEKSSSSG